MKLFTDLKQGDYIWGVHNINWDKNKPSEYYYYPTEYQLQKYVVIKNDLNVPLQKDISDRYEDPQYVTYYEHYIEINFHNLIYSRYYTDHYNEYKHLNMSAPFNNNGPWVEFFADYEDAKNYLMIQCNNGIDSCNKRIQEEEFKKSLYEKSLKQIE